MCDNLGPKFVRGGRAGDVETCQSSQLSVLVLWPGSLARPRFGFLVLGAGYLSAPFFVLGNLAKDSLYIRRLCNTVLHHHMYALLPFWLKSNKNHYKWIHLGRTAERGAIFCPVLSAPTWMARSSLARLTGRARVCIVMAEDGASSILRVAPLVGGN